MAGIFGICHFDDRAVEPALLERMSETLGHDGRDGEGVTIERSAVLGCRLLHATHESASRAQPVRCASGARLVFDGRLDNREDLISALQDRCDVSAAASDAELAAASYEVTGAEFARHLLGDFSVAVFDAREKRVVLARDSMGIRPLYYRRTSTSLAFASEIKTLLVDRNVQARPNDQLLAELLLRRTHRRQSDTSTLFAGICEVPPAHVVVFTAGHEHLRRYWDFDPRRPEGRQSLDAYADTFRHLLQRAVKRRLRSAHPVAIAVSGGLDSSAIFCAASEIAEVPIVGLTYTSRDGGTSDESAFVTEVERFCSRPIQYVDTPAEGMLFQSADMVRTVEAPMLSEQWWRGDRLMNAVTAAGARTLLTGHWGDQLLFDQAYLVDLLRTGAWPTIGAHLNEYLQWFPDARGDEFVTQFGSDVLEYALPQWVRGSVRAAKRSWTRPALWDDWYSESFRREARPDVFPHASGATARARAVYREVRSQYHDLCLDWNAKVGARYGCDVAFPFLDRDLVEFLMGVPGTVLAREGVPKALLRDSLRGTVPAAILTRRDKGDFTESLNQSTHRDLDSVVELLGPDPLAVQFNYVNADKLKRGLAASGTALKDSSTSVVSWRVTGVVALELWLRNFIGQPETRREDIPWRKTGLVNAQ